MNKLIDSLLSNKSIVLIVGDDLSYISGIIPYLYSSKLNNKYEILLKKWCNINNLIPTTATNDNVENILNSPTITTTTTTTTTTTPTTNNNNTSTNNIDEDYESYGIRFWHDFYLPSYLTNKYLLIKEKLLKYKNNLISLINDNDQLNFNVNNYWPLIER